MGVAKTTYACQASIYGIPYPVEVEAETATQAGILVTEHMQPSANKSSFITDGPSLVKVAHSIVALAPKTVPKGH